MNLALHLVEITLLVWIAVEVRYSARVLAAIVRQAADEELALAPEPDRYRSLEDVPLRGPSAPPYRVL